MNPAGVVLCIAGAWVLCQVLGGNALNRLGITTTSTSTGTGSGSSSGGTGNTPQVVPSTPNSIGGIIGGIASGLGPI